MISIDSQEAFNPWMERPDMPDNKCSALDVFNNLDTWDILFGSAANNDPDGLLSTIDTCTGFNDFNLEQDTYNFSSLYSPVKPEPHLYDESFSPVKFKPEMLILEDYLSTLAESLPNDEIAVDENHSNGSAMVENLHNKKVDALEKYAPSSPDSGFEQDLLNSSFDECGDVYDLLEQDKDVDGMCLLVKLTNDSEIEKFIDNANYLDDILHDKNSDTDEEFLKSSALISLSDIIDSDYISKCEKDSITPLDQKPSLVDLINGYGRSRNDSVSSDHWLSESISNSTPNDDISALYAGLVLQPIKKEYNKLNIKEEDCDDNLFVLRNDSKTIQVEHSYHKKLSVVESDEEIDEPVKKRKRNEVDEDFCPYQKPKRKAGRPRTNFSKADTQKTHKLKVQKGKAKRTTQTSKKLKSCSSVPFDRREQHNQAERERRDMLKRNLDVVEDITPDHVLHLTQIALQSEKTNKSDEFENNENNFTVDVLKRLDELIKKEPVNPRQKYKKASRNSKMVVLLGSTYYISSLEKELKSKESRLAQLKKQYDECLKRLNPTKSSSKKIRRNY